MNPIVTPDTNPVEFDMLGFDDRKRDGDLYKATCGKWLMTGEQGRKVSEGSPYKYFRRKPKQKEPMNKYYRLLNKGEDLRAGDIHFAYNRTEAAAPGIVGTSPRDGEYARPVEADEWVSVEDRLPQKEDWINDTIFVMLRSGEMDIWESDYAGDIELPNNATHWRRITPPVPQEKPILLNEGSTKREVVFHADGSLKVGCVDVDATTMDRIVEKWQKVKSEGTKS